MSADPIKSRAAATAEVSCVGKVAFTTFTQAQVVIQRNNKSRRAGRTAYHCDHCKSWHIGTDNGARGKARTEHKHA